MGWQPGRGDGKGAQSGPDPDLPGGHETPGASAGSAPPGTAVRDDRLTGFAKDGEWDTCPPSAALAAVLEAASGKEWRCPGATRDEMFGLLRQWAALESWAVAAKLGVLRALIREEREDGEVGEDGEQLPRGGDHGDLPDEWTGR